ncbi:YebC/PmpR family DNA-binding transcriptional regulator [Actomonas aquatica]|uniref:Probable transcriptional regulatory protein K1X11_016260 n=1 Tax=Actomonas aquatica TaxID=2866162 RepID=A0ABZ1C7U7_9BACT|nr:YebC/PmpR family DNA-binding transcriptional regulator [Opitutus sp. WL0086]WRQ86370.1 YebC/PmpR family DNA-binding transcriptional regulator [Opitutus sp. WL0086]
MAGHNKWSKIKRQKGANDAKRGKVFSRLSRDITLAAKSGGGDPDMNARLRTVLLKARAENMPVDNIDRAIKKGTGELPGVSYEDNTYEGYGPGGVAFIIRCTTDNKTRTSQDIRSILSKHGGNLASSGAVSFQFLHAGQFLIAKDASTEDQLMELALEAGADDVITSDEGYELRCEIAAFDAVAQALDQAGITPENAEIAYIPTNTVPVGEVSTARTLEKLHEALDDNDDVGQVFSNEELSDDVSAQLEEA